ncbi:TPA: hypothetical protein ACSVAN_004792 [Salmonella enterica subsp. diarizonae]|nr:hypothetical protein [Salmonella enterica]
MNTLMTQQVFHEPVWLSRMKSEDFRALMPLICAHINPYGIFELEVAERGSCLKVCRYRSYPVTTPYWTFDHLQTFSEDIQNDPRSGHFVATGKSLRKIFPIPEFIFIDIQQKS